MSIRALALELYKAKLKIDTLQKEHDRATSDDKPALAQELKMVRNEFQMLRRMLDGEKESGDFRKRFSGFGNSKT
jgi:hypothetical protein